MHILIINWRSISNPKAGGAEVATLELAKRWVANHNATVTWLCSTPSNNSMSEKVSGVEFVYVPVNLNVSNLRLVFNYPYYLFQIMLFYFKHFRGNVDVIVDQIHGLPNILSFLIKEKKFFYIHEVATNIWDIMYPFPVNSLGKLLEKALFYVYKNNYYVTVSQSTKLDLEHLGIAPTRITVVTNGINLEALTSPPEKEQVLTVLYLNRLVKMKGIERALSIFSQLKTKEPNAVFWIVGRGESTYVSYLNTLAKELGVAADLKFFGYVSEAKKADLLRRSHVLLNTSYKEGWGLVNIEANSQGTPVVSFDVPGNRDSVLNSVSGYICKTESECVDRIVSAYADVKLQESAISYAKHFDWNSSAEVFFTLLNA